MGDERMLQLLQRKLGGEAMPVVRRTQMEEGSTDKDGIRPCDKAHLGVLGEKAKCELSSAQEAEVQCRGKDGNVQRVKISRAEFEAASADLFARAMEPVVRVLEGAMMEPNTVDDVVLVGGASRMPKLRTMLQDFFGAGKKLHTEIDPDVTIAYGAANILD